MVKTSEISYRHFDKYVLRSTALGMDVLMELLKEGTDFDAELKKIFQRPGISEAIYLASPVLYNEILKWLDGVLTDERAASIRTSLLKYITRLCTRCTPFGLFAGCALGKFDNQTEIKLNSFSSYQRQSTLDNNVIIGISRWLSNHPEVYPELLFYPNSTLYVLHDKIRYLEYHYNENTRNHRMVEIDKTDLLMQLINWCTNGARLEDLKNRLQKLGVEESRAQNYLRDVIHSQILVSEMDPSLTGKDSMENFIDKLEHFNEPFSEILSIKEIQANVRKLDMKIGNPIDAYENIKHTINHLGIKSDEKNSFKVDLLLDCHYNTLSKNLAKELVKGLHLLNRITTPFDTTDLPNFIREYENRYGDKELPLCLALDPESGMGYPINRDPGNLNPLVDDLILNNNGTISSTTLQMSPAQKVLSEKLVTAEQTNAYSIRLHEQDFRDFPERWDDLPDTISSIVQLFGEPNETKIKVSGFYGPSAMNLLGRFTVADPKITAYCHQISKIEQNLNSNSILAEIVHLPGDRVGNVMKRAAIRDYEIPYLSRSEKASKFQIPVNDLYLSIRHGKELVLRSKRLNKEIKPRMGNAHSWNRSSLPVYKFLCDLQLWGKRNSLTIDYGPLALGRRFLPRIEYRNMILKPASWTFMKSEFDIFKTQNSPRELLRISKAFCKENRLPGRLFLKSGDNELYIDFSSIPSIEMLLNSIKKLEKVSFVEFFFDGKNQVKGPDGYYANQFVLAFYKSVN